MAVAKTIVRKRISVNREKASSTLAKRRAERKQISIMQIAKSKGSSKLAGSCKVKHYVLAAIQRVAMPGSTRSRQGQVRYPLQLTRRNIKRVLDLNCK